MLTMLTIWTMWTIKTLETGGSPKCGGQSESCEKNTLTELYWSSQSLANIGLDNDHYDDNLDLIISSNDYHRDD